MKMRRRAPLLLGCLPLRFCLPLSRPIPRDSDLSVFRESVEHPQPRPHDLHAVPPQPPPCSNHIRLHSFAVTLAESSERRARDFHLREADGSSPFDSVEPKGLPAALGGGGGGGGGQSGGFGGNGGGACQVAAEAASDGVESHARPDLAGRN